MSSIELKILSLTKKFDLLSTAEGRYHFLIDLGRALPLYPVSLKIPIYRVSGCQSTLYFFSRFQEGLLHFEADADALISKGLAALMISIYSGETPETILRTSPTFLSDLGILSSLTPSRSNGLAYIHKRIVGDALQNIRRHGGEL